MMSGTSVLARAIAGDMAAFKAISSWRHAELVAAADGKELLVRPDAVAGVLSSYFAGSIPADDARAWASFVRRGHTDNVEAAPFRPVAIEYEQAFEDEIVEAIFRMDELGDRVDGSIDAVEGARLLGALIDTPSAASR